MLAIAGVTRRFHSPAPKSEGELFQQRIFARQSRPSNVWRYWIELIKGYMAKQRSKLQPTWTDVKAKLEGFDRVGLLRLIQDLYAAHKDNQAFLHARFGLGENVLDHTRKRLIAGFGPTCSKNKTHLSPRPSKPSPITGRPLANPRGCSS